MSFIASEYFVKENYTYKGKQKWAGRKEADIISNKRKNKNSRLQKSRQDKRQHTKKEA